MDRIFLFRHGETAWSKSSQHTGTTDLPLTEQGKEEARLLARRFQGCSFDAVFCSPMQRARKTCELVGYSGQEQIVDALHEWNYGDYEGMTSAQIRKTRPDWNIFDSGAPNGESAKEVGERAVHLLKHFESLHGDIAVFSHGHFLRALAACYIGLSAREGRLFSLSTASVSILGYEKKEKVILLWNDTSHLSIVKTKR